jgi:putative chitinase
LQALLDAAVEFHITNDYEIAVFLTAVLQESNFLSEQTENLDYSAQRLIALWPAQINTMETARTVEHKPEQIGNLVYGGKKGNKDPGDGYKYRGRGFLGITGREFYRLLDQKLGLGSQLENNPDVLLQDRSLNARAAAAFYIQSGAQGPASIGDLSGAWRRLFGGSAGLNTANTIYDRIVHRAG